MVLSHGRSLLSLFVTSQHLLLLLLLLLILFSYDMRGKGVGAAAKGGMHRTHE